MPRTKKESSTETTNDMVITEENNKTVTPNDLEWTDYVLSLLSDDEKIAGNPTTDGLRRVFEIALNCTITNSSSDVIQSPSPENEKRATVIHSLAFVLNDPDTNQETKYRTVSGAADVYWGNCDKVYRNHPVAVAETRAEGRALRRALKLRKVVAAEELAKEIEDHPDGHNTSKISGNQINFIDVLSKRLDIDVNKMLNKFGHTDKNIYNIEHGDAINIINLLSSYQQDLNSISEDIKGYDANWR
jgi:hypothetical protein